ncbi:MAG TPA: DNA-3-methyladenine glycosylase I [bacterium]|jgi:DNA-3-methyladenine glycosylase I
MSRPAAGRRRCAWADGSALLRAYHDREWGVPVRRDRKHFEFLILDAFQAGLSWELILKKRAALKQAFAGFDPRRIARFGPREVRRLLADPGIIRNRGKIAATITNARRFLEVQREFGSFNAYVWSFVDGRPVRNRFRRLAQLPARTPTAEAMSRDLKRRGFKFVGPTICYAYMQAAGLVNDHMVDCFRYRTRY